jgi:hypothetical protein
MFGKNYIFLILTECLLHYIYSCFANFDDNQGVSIGGGIGSISDILDASKLVNEKVNIFLVL